MNRRNFILGGSTGLIGAAAVYYLLPHFRKNSNTLQSRFLRLEGDGPNRFNKSVQYKGFSIKGEKMSDGNLVPGAHDGMACFFDSQKNYVLLRNHELDFLPNSSPNSLAYDSKSFGGVTKVVVDQQLNLIEHELLLTGTSRNCSGGVTPWGTWLSGEECFFFNR